jgi:hypothetical protein
VVRRSVRLEVNRIVDPFICKQAAYSYSRTCPDDHGWERLFVLTGEFSFLFDLR